MPKEEHRLERLVRMAKERFDHSMELRLKSMMTESGRPAFMKELTPQERISRYFDPDLRRETMQGIVDVGGPEEVAKYLKGMDDLVKKEAGNAPTSTV